MSGAAYRQHKRQTWDVDALMAEADRAIVAAEYARATWEEQVDSQWYAEWLRRKAEASSVETSSATWPSGRIVGQAEGLRREDSGAGEEKGRSDEQEKETGDSGGRRECEKKVEARSSKGTRNGKDDACRVGEQISKARDRKKVERVNTGGDQRRLIGGLEDSSAAVRDDDSVNEFTGFDCADQESIRQPGEEGRFDPSSSKFSRVDEGMAFNPGSEYQGSRPFDQRVEDKKPRRFLSPPSEPPDHAQGSGLAADFARSRSEPNLADHQHDAAHADEAFRAGVAALDRKHPVEALALLGQAAAKCPPEKRAAVGKIQALIYEAEAMLRETEKTLVESSDANLLQMHLNARVNQTPTMRSSNSMSDIKPAITRTSLGKDGCHHPSQRRGSALSSEDVIPHQSNPIGPKIGCLPDAPPSDRLSQVSIGPNAQAADESFRAGVAALEAGDVETAMQFLNRAAEMCPPEKKVASMKIRKLIGQTMAQLNV